MYQFIEKSLAERNVIANLEDFITKARKKLKRLSMFLSKNLNRDS